MSLKRTSLVSIAGEETSIFMLALFIFLCSLLAVQGQQGNGGCRTPDNDPGRCTAIHSCRPMLDALEKIPQPPTAAIRKRLKAFQCGFEGRNPKVCCPSGPIDLNGGAQSGPEPPDVSAHRNIRLLPTNCGHLDTTDKIVYGNKTELFEFPWMALLSYRSSSGPRFKCGGTIINQRYILTAAHCLTNLRDDLIGVRVGEHDIRTTLDCMTPEDPNEEEICAPPIQELGIEQVIFHPGYNAKLFLNDIGLIRVTPPIDLARENSRPVCLPVQESRNYNFTGRNVIVTGWGYTEKGRASPELLKVLLPVIPLDECKRKYASIATLNDRQMCAGGKGKSDSCGGDSGGPLHAQGPLHGDHRYVQQGIVSFGPRNCGNEPIPGVYTRVAWYMDWILDNLRA